MKKSTCKILIAIGLIYWILIILGMVWGIISGGGIRFGVIVGVVILGIPFVILILIGIFKWNSEQEKAETLKSRAKVHVHIQGKMEDIESKGSFCSECGAKLNPNAKHCSKCGSKQ